MSSSVMKLLDVGSKVNASHGVAEKTARAIARMAASHVSLQDALARAGGIDKLVSMVDDVKGPRKSIFYQPRNEVVHARDDASNPDEVDETVNDEGAASVPRLSNTAKRTKTQASEARPAATAKPRSRAQRYVKIFERRHLQKPLRAEGDCGCDLEYLKELGQPARYPQSRRHPKADRPAGGGCRDSSQRSRCALESADDLEMRGANQDGITPPLRSHQGRWTGAGHGSGSIVAWQA